MLKEPFEGQKKIEFSLESSDLSELISFARDKAEMFSQSNIESVYMSFGKDGKYLNMKNVLFN